MLALDGAALVQKDLDRSAAAWADMKPFIEQSLSKCAAPVGDVWRPLKPTIVTMHYPVFSALAVGQQEMSDQMITAMTQLFNTYRVAIVLSGHEHLYMRYQDQGFRDAGYQAFLTIAIDLRDGRQFWCPCG